MSAIRVLTFDPAAGLRTGGEELLGQIPAGPGCWVWADFEGVDKTHERTLLMEHFKLELLAIQDAQRERHPPKHELFNKYLFLLLRDISDAAAVGNDLTFSHLAFFAGENFLVTRHDRPCKTIDQIWESTTVEELQKGPSHNVYRLCRKIVDYYTPYVIEMEEKLGDLEDRLFEQPGDEVLEELSDYNRILKKLRRTLTYQHRTMEQVSRGEEGILRMFDDHEFNDIYENMERLASLSQLNQELAIDLLNTHLSIASHRLNEIMRVLTIVTVIFVPLGLLAGIYGMNFENMPELKWHYGYFAIVGTMLTVVTTLVVVFKRKKWL